jgi:hypothetical protein
VTTNCPNCGAPVDPSADRCAYCETPYQTTQRPTMRIDATGITFYGLQLENGLMTPNEARRCLGLPLRGVTP